MSARWKYMIKIGLFWGVFMTAAAHFFSGENFVLWKVLLQFAVHTAAGIFVIGYFNWREIQKQKEKNR